MSGTEKRHSFRNSLFLTARCRIHGHGGEMIVKLRNISAQGLMAEGPQVPPGGALVSLELRNVGWVEGSVAWVQDNRFGIIFAQEINPVFVKQPPAPTESPRSDDIMARRPLSVRLRQIERDPTSVRRI